MHAYLIHKVFVMSNGIVFALFLFEMGYKLNKRR